MSDGKIHMPQPSEDSAGKSSVPPNPKPRAKTGRKAGARWARQDLTGMRFERLTVESAAQDHVGKNGARAAYWNCRCDCGKAKAVMGHHLKRGLIRSCGCYSAEIVSLRSRTHEATRHGKTTGTYRSWCAMKTRCTNANQPGAKDYVLRGISVCDRWMDSFENFLADMGERPPGCSIDRINNDGNYEPGNCRWATTKEQAANKRRTNDIELCGFRMSLIKWAAYFKISPHLIYHQSRKLKSRRAAVLWALGEFTQ
jgi:hypothetical protein